MTEEEGERTGKLISFDDWDPQDDDDVVDESPNEELRAFVKFKVAELRAMYVATSRDTSLDEQFERLLEEKDCGAPERRWAGLLVKAPSGCGKSRMLREFLQNHPRISGYATPQSNFSAIQVPSPVTNRSLGIAVVRTMYPQIGNGKSSRVNKADTLADIWTEARSLAEEIGVWGLWIDESHDLATGGANTLRVLQLTFKRWMAHAHRPILVLSGTPDVEEILTTRELRRRFLDVDCPSISVENDGAEMRRVIAKYLRKAELGIDPSLQDIMGRLIHAGTRQLGWTCDVVIEAIRVALLSQSDRLSIDHFATSYGEIVRCTDDDNPFLAADWAGIDTVLQRERIGAPAKEEPKRRRPRKDTPW